MKRFLQGHVVRIRVHQEFSTPDGMNTRGKVGREHGNLFPFKFTVFSTLTESCVQKHFYSLSKTSHGGSSL